MVQEKVGGQRWRGRPNRPMSYRGNIAKRIGGHLDTITGIRVIGLEEEHLC